jgi:hypothetical protein
MRKSKQSNDADEGYLVNYCQQPLPVALAELERVRKTSGQNFLSSAHADGEGVPVDGRKVPDIDPAAHRRATGYQDVNEGRALTAPSDILCGCVRCWRFYIHRAAWCQHSGQLCPPPEQHNVTSWLQ